MLLSVRSRPVRIFLSGGRNQLIRHSKQDNFIW